MQTSIAEENNILNITLEGPGKTYLLQAARWAKLVSVFLFIALGVLIVVGVLMGNAVASALSQRPIDEAAKGVLTGTAVGLISIITAVFYIYPTYALFRFSGRIRPAILNGDKDRFDTALRYLRNMFRYFGIMIIVVCLVIIIFAALAGNA
jgi:Na+-transporting NADH:ubiquinone oxidoreductase subunit NqrD